MNKIYMCFLSVALITAAMLTGCKKEKGVTIDTTSITNITQISAASGGTIIRGGGLAVKSYGVCWSTSPDPTVNDSNIKDSLRTSIEWYTCKIIGLQPGTVYHLRAYAVYDAGPMYGNDISFTTLSYGNVTDVDGNVYKTLTFGTQTWMEENLKTTKFQNGDLIGTTTPATLDITSIVEPEYQWAYNGDENDAAANGRYYTFYAVKDSRNICPAGWHVPPQSDWLKLIDYLRGNGYGFGGDIYKIGKSVASQSGWTTDLSVGDVGNNQETNNSSGFTALPCGLRIDPGFGYRGELCGFWTSTESSSTEGNDFQLYSFFEDLFLNAYPKSFGLPVRCLKD